MGGEIDIDNISFISTHGTKFVMSDPLTFDLFA